MVLPSVGPRALAFDVNETLLDLSALDPLLERVLGEPGLRPRWFARMLQIAFAGALAGGYVDYPTAQRSALEGLAGRALSAGEVDALRAAMTSLPAHPDVPDALARLREGGFRMAALTNGTQAAADAQIDAAGLRGSFDAVLSADTVRALKPAAAAYGVAVAWAGVPAAEIRMIAAHDWDVQGAMAAGLAGAFVARPGQPWSAVWPRPDVWGSDLGAVADQLLAA